MLQVVLKFSRDDISFKSYLSTTRLYMLKNFRFIAFSYIFLLCSLTLFPREREFKIVLFIVDFCSQFFNYYTVTTHHLFVQRRCDVFQ